MAAYAPPVRDLEIEVAGRTVGVTDYGGDGEAVLWCHGGPGSRREPALMGADLTAAGFRMVGIDRPGYGASTPWPGRTIADWLPQGIAVADHLGIERFVAVGVSTGGAYALALAAMHPERVSGAVLCCALTDMRWAEGKAMMPGPGTAGIWEAPDRETALQIAGDTFGEDGSKMATQADPDAPPTLAPSDMALLADPAFGGAFLAAAPLMFAHGVQGYVDDRRADGPGWVSFDVSAVSCPVVVLHGESDLIVPVAHAHHTAAIVPGARLDIRRELGHLSIAPKIVEAVSSL